MLEHMCRLGGAKLQSEPGPEPVQARRYQEISFCNTTQFVLVHSWTNGAALLVTRPDATANPASALSAVAPSRCSPSIDTSLSYARAFGHIAGVSTAPLECSRCTLLLEGEATPLILSVTRWTQFAGAIQSWQVGQCD